MHYPKIDTIISTLKRDANIQLNRDPSAPLYILGQTTPLELLTGWLVYKDLSLDQSFLQTIHKKSKRLETVYVENLDRTASRECSSPSAKRVMKPATPKSGVSVSEKELEPQKFKKIISSATGIYAPEAVSAAACMAASIVAAPVPLGGSKSYTLRKLFKDASSIASGKNGVVANVKFSNSQGEATGIYLLKIPKKPEYSNDLIHEAFIGFTVLNHMRLQIPNFMYTYAIFKCNMPIDFTNLSNEATGYSMALFKPAIPSAKEARIVTWCIGGSKPAKKNTPLLNYLVIENVNPAGSLFALISNGVATTTTSLISIIGQITCALWLANSNNFEFGHNDLHTENVLMRPWLHPIQSSNFYIDYTIPGQQKISIRTKGIASIVDYGQSYGRSPGDKIGFGYPHGHLQAYQYPDRANPAGDLFKLICFALSDLITAVGIREAFPFSQVLEFFLAPECISTPEKVQITIEALRLSTPTLDLTKILSTYERKTVDLSKTTGMPRFFKQLLEKNNHNDTRYVYPYVKIGEGSNEFSFLKFLKFLETLEPDVFILNDKKRKNPNVETLPINHTDEKNAKLIKTSLSGKAKFPKLLKMQSFSADLKTFQTTQIQNLNLRYEFGFQDIISKYAAFARVLVELLARVDEQNRLMVSSPKYKALLQKSVKEYLQVLARLRPTVKQISKDLELARIHKTVTHTIKAVEPSLYPNPFPIILKALENLNV
jgi:hypothetical protein